MELEKVTAEIRPRSEWEAIDLGVSLTRRHAKGILKGWMVTVFPICLLITLACLSKPGWAVFAIWWLKPLFERVALFELSRELFGEKPTMRGRLRSFGSQFKICWLLILLGIGLTFIGFSIHGGGESKPLAMTLFWLTLIGLAFYRSFLTRSLTLPVRFLEGLKGAAYSKRTQLLSRRSSGAAGGLTSLALIVEIGLVWSLANFVGMMLPAGTEWSVGDLGDWGRLTSEMITGNLDFFTLPALVAVVGIYFIAMSLTAWFYVGGGFGLYVNTRTWTEGWDIELNFKRIGQRLPILIGLLLCFGFSDLKADTPKEALGEVLAHEDFTVHKHESKRWVSDKKEELDDSDSDSANVDLSAFAIFGKMLFWIIVVALVGLLIWAIINNRHLFEAGPSESVSKEKKKIKTVAGLEVAPESLPADVVATARNLWLQGQRKEALGLLYRGAISWVITQDVAEIEESDTEMDCVRRVKTGEAPEVTHYFETLTHTWMGAAYGGVFPEDDGMETIWSTWPFKGRRSR